MTIAKALSPDLTYQVNALDNCTPVNELIIPGSGCGYDHQRPAGTQQVVTFTVSDASGNSTTCSTVLTLVDDDVPSVASALRHRMY